MNYNLGNYGSQLSIDDYNQALKAGGSSYQFDMGAQQQTAQPVAMEQEPAPLAPEAPSPYNIEPPKEDKKQPVFNVGKILGLVGTLVGGGAGAAIGGLGSLTGEKK